MTANGPLVQFAGSSIRFATDHPGLLNSIETHFQHCLAGDGKPVAEYQISFGQDAAFTVSRDGGVSLSGVDSERVLGYLMQDGLTQLNGASETHLVFHAAALAHQDRGLVIFGKSGSGKSTLAASLVSGGFDYLTDEVIALPVEADAPLSGFCRSLVLKRGSAFLWERWRDQAGADGLLLFKDGTAWVAPTLLHPASPRSEVTPQLLLFARYEAGAVLKAESLSTANSLFQLLQTLVNARNFEDRGMGAASRLARNVPAFALTYSDLESAAEWIQQRIERD